MILTKRDSNRISNAGEHPSFVVASELSDELPKNRNIRIKIDVVARD